MRLRASELRAGRERWPGRLARNRCDAPDRTCRPRRRRGEGRSACRCACRPRRTSRIRASHRRTDRHLAERALRGASAGARRRGAGAVRRAAKAARRAPRRRRPANQHMAGLQPPRRRRKRRWRQLVRPPGRHERRPGQAVPRSGRAPEGSGATTVGFYAGSPSTARTPTFSPTTTSSGSRPVIGLRGSTT